MGLNCMPSSTCAKLFVISHRYYTFSFRHKHMWHMCSVMQCPADGSVINWGWWNLPHLTQAETLKGGLPRQQYGAILETYKITHSLLHSLTHYTLCWSADLNIILHIQLGISNRACSQVQAALQPTSWAIFGLISIKSVFMDASSDVRAAALRRVKQKYLNLL